MRRDGATGYYLDSTVTALAALRLSEIPSCTVAGGCQFSYAGADTATLSGIKSSWDGTNYKLNLTGTFFAGIQAELFIDGLTQQNISSSGATENIFTVNAV